jgi:hypothetical protein
VGLRMKCRRKLDVHLEDFKERSPKFGDKLWSLIKYDIIR